MRAVPALWLFLATQVDSLRQHRRQRFDFLKPVSESVQ
jgi:hypothetical protein